VQALNRGTPPVIEHSTKAIGAMLEDWAYGFSSAADQRRPADKASPALQRVHARIQQRRKAKAS
jgi:hypothetical protein